MNKQIDELLSNANNVAVITHLNPDGDAYGSISAVYKYITSKFSCNVHCFAECDRVTQEFKDVVEGVVLNVKPKDKYDVCITLDCADKNRLGKYLNVFECSAVTVCIDHHQTNTGFADINIIDKVSSNCEILYYLLKNNNFKFTKEIQSVLYVGMLTDTNNFTIPLVNDKTYMVLADFAKNGVNMRDIYKHYFSNTLVQFKLLACAMSSVKMFEDDKIMFMKITKRQTCKLGATKEDFSGVINQAFNIRDCVFAILITPRDGKEHCSLRCRAGLDVSSIASRYGGGGHLEASAFKVDKISKSTLKDIIECMGNQLKKISTTNKKLFE